MSVKKALTIALTKRTLLLIEKLVNLNCSITGLENIPKSSPIIFAPNHFTRFETFLVPHVLNQIEGLKFSRSLAASSLFTSILGTYLTNLKTLSTADENRDETIINNLANNEYNWVIYPEGMMVKDKKREVYSGILRSRFSIKTGSIVLAIKAEMIRRKENKSNQPVCIVPVTISYIPMHPQDNKILQIAQRFAKRIPKRLEEELTVEGSLLLNSKTIIHFEKPIFISDYITKEEYINHTNHDIVVENKISKYRIPIALRLANEIYQNTIITHEHIISLILKISKQTSINKEKLLFYVISSVILLKKHSNIKQWYEILKGEKLFNSFHQLNTEIEQFLELLSSQKLIRIENNLIYIEDKFFQEQDFESVRLQNISKLFLNEILYFPNTESVIKKLLKESDFEITQICLDGIEDAYIQQHKSTFNAKYSIQIKYGKPIFVQNSKNHAVLLIHGYKSSPFEMNAVAKFFHNQGYTCYCVRMAGHGTSPFDMANTTQDDWYTSVEIAYKILQFTYKDITVCGFSTGGLIATRLAINYEIPKIILINVALQLEDIRFRFVKFANLWSDVMKKIKTDHKQYIEEEPFFADTNYSINHFSCMVELSKLMEYCKKNMHKVKCETLIVTSMKDPVVSPKSGQIVYNAIESSNKKLVQIDSDDHVITRGNSLPHLLSAIEDFATHINTDFKKSA